MAEFDFGIGFRRLVLATAIRSSLLSECPGIFQAQHFGAGQPPSPLQRLAQLVETYAKENQNQRPGHATMDELVAKAAKRLKPQERQVFEAEWKAIRDCVVDDPAYVRSRFVRFCQEAALRTLLSQTAEAVSQAKEHGATIDIPAIARQLDGIAKIGVTPGRGVSWLNSGYNHWSPDQRKRVPTRLIGLDKVLSGGPAFGELFFILAPPKSAKTCMLLNLSKGAASRGHGVAFFSYEMRLPAMLHRTDRSAAKADRHTLETDLSSIMTTREGYSLVGGDIWMQEFQARKQGCEEAARIVERLRGEGREIDLVVLDYLNIMNATTAEKEKRHELATISREMSQLAKELDVVLWSAALVNRKAVNKLRITKDDIAEAFEVIAVLDGAVAICSNELLRAQGLRNLFAAALREAQDEVSAGTYTVDLDRMLFTYDAEASQAFANGGMDGDTSE